MVKNILIVCNDSPYPTIHGGRMDMWNRIKGFAKLGLRIQLIYWYDSSPTTENDKRSMYEYVDSILEVHRRMSLTNLLHHKYPPRMMSCNITGSQFDELLLKVNEFCPDCVWLDLWFGYFAAKKISLFLRIPLIYRSQNVEFQYLQQLHNDAVGMLKFKLFLNLLRIKKAELEVRTESDFVYDISKTDNDAWKKEAPTLKSKVLLPTWIPPGKKLRKDDLHITEDIDILFVGNLNNPSNISGLKWFMTNVLEKIRDKVGNIRTVFVGSNPGPEIRSLCEKYSVDWIANTENVYTYYDRAKVIINPQLEGSGISLKMIELLLISKPVVSTTVGVRGLPDEVISNFCIANTSEEFAESITSYLYGVNNANFLHRNDCLEKYFGLDKLAAVIDEISYFKKVKRVNLS
jgi:polysaccharide biosynthesis protein PslH